MPAERGKGGGLLACRSGRSAFAAATRSGDRSARAQPPGSSTDGRPNFVPLAWACPALGLRESTGSFFAFRGTPP
jgi:hypothetical protein